MGSSKKGRILHATPLESRDGKSILRYVWVSAKDGRKGAKEGGWEGRNSVKNIRKKPVLVVGFPGAGLVGSISTNYVIEKMNLRQIAFVDSDYVMPTVIFTGGRLRHPFRIYSDKGRMLYVMVCEAPVMPEGIHSIMDLVATWSLINNVGEVIVLDGIPIQGFPNKDRKPEVLKSYSDQDNLSLSGEVGKDASVNSKEKSKVKGAVITGLSAGVLESCLSFNIPCTGILIPASSGVPDPEGAAILLETVSAMPNVPIKVDITPLRKQGDEIKRQLGVFIEEFHARQQEGRMEGQPATSPHLGGPTIYG
jgi:uncharacterized protein